MRSSTEAMSTSRPVLSSGSPRAGMAVVTKTRSPQITGLEWPIPGKGVFQAMFSPDEDGAIKHVMSGVNPQGCQVFSFKQPSSEELNHDFLWRTDQRLPERGRIGIFNRSYCEEVPPTALEAVIRRRPPDEGLQLTDKVCPAGR
jgi:hypothetical protein